MNTDLVPLLAVLLMLIKDVGKSWKVSACHARVDSLFNDSLVKCFAWLVAPLATPTLLVNCGRVGRPALKQFLLLM